MERHGAIGRFRMCAGCVPAPCEERWLCGVRKLRRLKPERRRGAQGEDGRSGEITRSLSALHLRLRVASLVILEAFSFSS
jgi:hypothetical protein